MGQVDAGKPAVQEFSTFRQELGEFTHRQGDSLRILEQHDVVTPSVAFVTPSYRLDRDRCALLSRSLEVCAPWAEHWIVVDRDDLPLFRSLQNARTNVVAKEEVLPLWVRRIDTLRIGLRSNVWLQAHGKPIRGWLLQQLIKLAVAEELTADVLVHADSDVVLVRPFSISSVVDGNGQVRLFEVPDAIDATLPHHVLWHRSAEKLLELEPAELPIANHISSLVPWKRANAVELLDEIQRNTGRHWLPALAAAWHVSEYTLYGRFVQDVLGKSAGQFVSSSPLSHDYYKRVPLAVPELEALLDRVGPEEVAVSLTSKAGMKPEDYVDVLETRWAALGVQEPAAKEAQLVSRRATPSRRRSVSRRSVILGEATQYILTRSAFVMIAVMCVLVLFGLD
jgi:Family of unknown function (DUF6492)